MRLLNRSICSPFRKRIIFHLNDFAIDVSAFQRPIRFLLRMLLASNNITPKLTRKGILLGSPVFRARYQTELAYAVGAMYRGISSVSMVAALAKAGVLSFFGTGGLPAEELEHTIGCLAAQSRGLPFGVNFFNQPSNAQAEALLARLIVEHDIRNIEASAFTKPEKSLIALKAGSLYKEDGEVHCRRRLLIKLSRPEIAASFLDPPDPAILAELVTEGVITDSQSEWASAIPVADDIMVEADSGGHTDNGILHVILEGVIRERNKRAAFCSKMPVHVGIGGGMGSPMSAALAFMLGADFIFTGSVNQCTVEAGTSDAVKDLLQTVGVNHMAMAASGNMFEAGARIQVVKKNTLFPSRANMLYALYQNLPSVENIDSATRAQLEGRFFFDSLENVWNDIVSYYQRTNPHQLQTALKSPKHRLALVCRSYFARSNKWTLNGDPAQKLNYQIHCGPAMGVFNNWVAGTELEPWQNRHCASIAHYLMDGAAEILAAQAEHWKFLNENSN